MKYRAKRDFLGVTKGMEFQDDAVGDICIPTKIKLSDNVCWIDPTQYPDDFELVEEPKYTDSDLDYVVKRCNELFRNVHSHMNEDVLQAIEELKQSKEKE